MLKAETMFKEYKNMKREMDTLRIQLESETGISVDDMIKCMTFGGVTDSDRVQTSNISDTTSRIAMDYRKRMWQENEAYYKFLYDRYSGLKKELDFFVGAIRSLGGKKSEVLLALVVEGLTWDQISDQYDICKKTITNYRKTAIKDIDALYEKRKSTELTFILS